MLSKKDNGSQIGYAQQNKGRSRPNYSKGTKRKNCVQTKSGIYSSGPDQWDKTKIYRFLDLKSSVVFQPGEGLGFHCHTTEST